LLPLLLTPLASLQRSRLVAAAPASVAEPVAPRRDDSAEPDWRHAYLRLREEEAPVAPGVLPAPGRPPVPAQRREQEETRRDVEPMPSTPSLLTPMPGRPEAAPLAAVSPTATAERVIEAVRQIGEAAPAPIPAARVWQLELPAVGQAWQLHVEQAQPQAPLNVELRVPPVAQTQARQQLGDLDKRLREAGHDVLRSRLRTDRKRGPVDGVSS